MGHFRRNEEPVLSVGRGSEVMLSPGTREGGDESDLATRVQQLEDYWQQLNSLPTNSEMFRRLHQFKQIEQGLEDDDGQAAAAAEPVIPATESEMPACRPRQPMLELWHAMQLLNQVENNTAGITRVRHCCNSVALPEFGGRVGAD